MRGIRINTDKLGQMFLFRNMVIVLDIFRAPVDDEESSSMKSESAVATPSSSRASSILGSPRPAEPAPQDIGDTHKEEQEEEGEAMPVPQVTIGEDGEIVIKESRCVEMNTGVFLIYRFISFHFIDLHNHINRK